MRIREALDYLVVPGGVVEVRCLGGGWTQNGYFDDLDQLAKSAASKSGTVGGVYITLNQINPDLIARKRNRIDQAGRDGGTSDSDIVSRRWLPFDFDPVRPTGTSSTDQEHQKAIDRAKSVRGWLRGQGWPDPISADSGNGAHLLYRIELPNDNASRDRIAAILRAIALRFGDETVAVDPGVFNASRIWKLYGTLAAKGDSTAERPHRLAKILEAPDRLLPVDPGHLEALARTGGTQDRASETEGDLDVDAWLLRHSLEVLSRGPWNNGRKWVFKICPFDAEHNDRSAVLIQFKSGALAFRCHHRSCSGKGWRELRALYEPPTDEVKWDRPLPFHIGDLPEFPVDALPEPLRDFVIAEARATQTPPALAGGLVLTACAIGASRKFRVRVRNGWDEPINLYTVSILPSGELKTPVVSAVSQPIEEFESSEWKRLAPQIREARARRRIVEQRLKKAEKQAAETPDDPALEENVLRLAQELDRIPVPVRPRLLVDDVTPEQLITLLSRHGGRMAVVSAEGGIFDLMRGRYSGSAQPNFEVFLKGYSGEALRIDRVGREAEHVKEPALCIALAVQPEVIHGLACVPGFRGKGLIARFLFAWPKSLLGGRDPDAPPVPSRVGLEYRRIITALLEMPFDTDGGDGETIPRILTLTPPAYASLLRFRSRLEPRIGPDGDLSWISDWVGKLSGGTARIAAILHVAAHATDPTGLRQPIEQDTMLRAITLAEFYLAHAQRTLGQMGANPEIEKAEQILAWMLRTKPSTFSKRDAFNALRGRFQLAAELDSPLGLLTEHSFIAERTQAKRGGPGRPGGPIYETNPFILNSAYCADFAAGEENRTSATSPPPENQESESDPSPQYSQNAQNSEDRTAPEDGG